MIDRDRAEALTAARLAVRAYAKDPTPENEANVESAYSVLRRMDAISSSEQRRVVAAKAMPTTSRDPVLR